MKGTKKRLVLMPKESGIQPIYLGSRRCVIVQAFRNKVWDDEIMFPYFYPGKLMDKIFSFLLELDLTKSITLEEIRDRFNEQFCYESHYTISLFN